MTSFAFFCRMTNADFYDNEKIEKDFYPECEATVRGHTCQASRVW